MTKTEPDDWKTWVLVVLIVIGGILLFLIIIAAIFAFYGAILGAIGAAIYLTFKAIVGVLL